mmetsp:Transcript_38246/g.113370  ORF Transcript_38246/g.113370 Transcript_38246/m.113370 type:complete len:233 (+) Transcript_38246:201-899(+)
MLVSFRCRALICAFMFWISAACALTSCTSLSRSSTSCLRATTGSEKTDVRADASVDSSRRCAAVMSDTALRHAVFSRVSASSSSARAAMRASQSDSSRAYCASCVRSCSRRSSVPLDAPARSSKSRSMTCPNLSICTSCALDSSSDTRASFARLSLSSCRCSRLSAFWRARSSSFSASSSSMRRRRRASSASLNTSDEDRSSGSRPSTRYSIWCMRSDTTTSIWLSWPCFSR